MPKLKYRKKMITLNIRLDPAIVAKFDKLVIKLKQSRSQIIRDAIQITLDKLGKI